MGVLNDPESHSRFCFNPGLEEEDNNSGPNDHVSDDENQDSGLEEEYNGGGPHGQVSDNENEDHDEDLGENTR